MLHGPGIGNGTLHDSLVHLSEAPLPQLLLHHHATARDLPLVRFGVVEVHDGGLVGDGGVSAASETVPEAVSPVHGIGVATLVL